MELLVTKISVLQMFGYGDLFKLNTKLLINKDVLLLLVLIEYPSDSLTCEHQIIDILMSYSEMLLDLLQELLEELRSA